jgi:hypothetical protein
MAIMDSGLAVSRRTASGKRELIPWISGTLKMF